MPAHKLVAYARCGGKATLSAYPNSETIGGGAKDLSQLEFDQYKHARLIAAPVNGGDLTQAKAYLEEHDWTCYWDGPAPNDSLLQIRLPSDLKAWALTHGGSDMIRRLIEAARERQEAEQSNEAPA